MSRLHRQKLRALARAGDTPANRPDPLQEFVQRGQSAQAAVDQVVAAAVKPSRTKRSRRKAVRKSTAKAKHK